ncbi:MAG: hypothetical protein JO121_26280 [Deltaproteobacteria bacterium]|nr:hypothetical protein [Deltaproteobacteria bacterium]
MKKVLAGLALLLLVVSIATAQRYAQVPPDGGGGFGGGGFGGEGGPTDPGVQAGNRNTGAPLGSVSTTDGTLQFFQNGLSRFNATDSVSNSPTANNGLGPRFNSNSCVSCHGQPAPGGTGPAVNPQFLFTNGSPPLVAPNNSTPSFITANGPTREARFPFFFNSSGQVNTSAPNGGVEDLFTVTGRADAGSCALSQPPFEQAAQANNIIFRIPLATFGDGLVENLDESTLLSNQSANLNNNFGVAGTFNHNGNDGTIARFGWKAQNKSLELFAGEAYNVEQGVSNEVFTQDRPLPEEDQSGTGLPANCLNLSLKGYPEDSTNFTATPNQDPFVSNASVPSDVVQFAMFMRFLAPPPTGGVVRNGQSVSAETISNGAALFSSVGCATCHNSVINSTQPSSFTASLSQQPVNAFSDFEIHHMGAGLADNVGQGGAGGDQFKTAPLWGLGQRIFLLHDGRTSNLFKAILQHQGQGSEANNVIEAFTDLDNSQQQAVLDFLRSL